MKYTTKIMGENVSYRATQVFSDSHELSEQYVSFMARLIRNDRPTIDLDERKEHRDVVNRLRLWGAYSNGYVFDVYRPNRYWCVAAFYIAKYLSMRKEKKFSSGLIKHIRQDVDIVFPWVTDAHYMEAMDIFGSSIPTAKIKQKCFSSFGVEYSNDFADEYPRHWERELPPKGALVDALAPGALGLRVVAN